MPKPLQPWKATKICCELGYDRIKVVGDAKSVVEAVNSNIPPTCIQNLIVSEKSVLTSLVNKDKIPLFFFFFF